MRIVALLIVAAGCAGTKPGTHVEIVDKGGQKVYVAGAAAQGINKDAACSGAVGRAVASIALKFGQEEEDIAEDVGDLVGVDDGVVFLERYAKAAALDGALQDVSFDPVDHTCMATVSWTPPVFIKEAMVKYAEKLKKQELGEAPAPVAAAPGSNDAEAAPAPRTTAPAPAAPPPDPCRTELKKLDKVAGKTQKAVDDFDECMRRSKDETICHRYKLYKEEATANEASATSALAKCKERHGL